MRQAAQKATTRQVVAETGKAGTQFRVKGSSKRILSVTLKRMVDSSPDTSWLGEYADSATSEFSIDRAHDLDCPQQTYNHVEVPNEETHNIKMAYARACKGTCADCGSTPDECIAEPCEYYENGCTCDSYDSAAHSRRSLDNREYRYFNPSFNYVDKNGHAKDLTAAEVIDYTRQDYERMESLNAGQWGFIGIRAEAEIQLGSDLCQTIISGGLWGVESDSDREHLASIEQEELAELRAQLAAVRFSQRAISAAYRDVERKGE